MESEPHKIETDDGSLESPPEGKYISHGCLTTIIATGILLVALGILTQCSEAQEINPTTVVSPEVSSLILEVRKYYSDFLKYGKIILNL